jgi:hypothetical protein
VLQVTPKAKPKAQKPWAVDRAPACVQGGFTEARYDGRLNADQGAWVSMSRYCGSIFTLSPFHNPNIVFYVVPALKVCQIGR